jgi:4-alpha-glucanotransferase
MSPPGGTHTAHPDREKLERDAAAAGIETAYWDVWGREHHARPEVIQAILDSLGDGRRSGHAILPATIVLHGPPHEISISVPAEGTHAPARLEIRLEGGGTLRLEASLRDSAQVRLPDEIPCGYHELAITIAGQEFPASRLIVCPSQVYQPACLESGRIAGLAISLYGLRSERNWGCGDVTDLEALIDWVAQRADASFIAVNPLHAIFNRAPYNTSPYLPNSIYYRNPIYLDVERIEEFGTCTRAQSLRASVAVQREIRALRDAEFVEYERVHRLKLRFLKLLFGQFLEGWGGNSKRVREFRRYIEEEGDLLDRFAVHSALDEALHRQCPDLWTWPQWPEPYQDPGSAATAQFAKKHWRSVLFHKYAQWQLDLQFARAQQHARDRGLAIGLYHDLALATDRFGSDLWAHRDFFVSGCRVGAPPDSFSPKGQDWAFPPPDSARHYQDGYRLFAESIRKNSRHGGALRIDHVMRFFRLYWIPDGFEATEGTYVRDRWRDLLGVLALESVREKVAVVGEDLGTVPDEVREALRSFGILSYRLLYFERDANGTLRRPGEYPRDALASATTHDLPTLAGFWLGRDIEARRDAGLLPEDATYRRMLDERAREKQHMLDALIQLNLLPDWFPRNAAEVPELNGELHNAIVGFLASTPSKLMVLNQEDLLKETEQQNLPGTTQEYPNWRRKMRCTVEELWTSAEIGAFSAMFHGWLEHTGRLNSTYMK